ncbi:thermostable hemolysin [Paracoccus zhejiangensis]|uniref:Thermostable hemolysin n=1 Tax=Paracoccus zhejiangensis TaxID=1077935 RepID=A0A2H5EU98_9RHOB|nr:thermostable hemolysin [Paracoccus zhejiangensis]AUH62870.1 hypothetical protein CX676_00725 [Paracoccus zhejiangensis]
MQVEFLTWRDAGWQAAASLIETHFARAHGAAITLSAVRLAVAMSRSGAILGAAGMRDAAQGFFSQVYLDQPIAALLSERSGLQVLPETILEIVSMACPRPMATLPLIEAITAEGRRQGRSWGLFTATGSLMRLLRHAGVPLMQLCPARPERLAGAASWGRYYDSEPWVCAVHEGAERLRFMPRPAAVPTGVQLA